MYLYYKNYMDVRCECLSERTVVNPEPRENGECEKKSSNPTAKQMKDSTTDNRLPWIVSEEGAKLTRYKFLDLIDGKMVSHHDNSEWTVGQWRTVEPPSEECKGLNASQYIQDALGYVRGNILAEVECDGKIIHGNDKDTCERMRILRTWIWTKEDSVTLAIIAAEDCIDVFEKKYPNDDRPRKAIESAKAWLKNPNEETMSAAAAAADAATARAAAAADAAAWAAARNAVWAADAAADARAAAAAADAAARTYKEKDRCKRRIHERIISYIRRVKTKDEQGIRCEKRRK